MPSVILILIYCTEGYGKIAEKAAWVEKSNVAMFTKLAIILWLTPFFIKHWRRSLWFLAMGVIFVIGQLTIPDGFKEEMIVTFAKYLFPIALFIFFHRLSSKGQQWRLLFKTFQAILIVNSLLIIVGFIFDLKWFYAYKWGRFGFNGLLNVSSTSTYVYIIGQMCYLLWYKVDFFKKWPTYLLIVASILMGTKGVILGLLFTFLAYFLFYSNLSMKKKKLILFVVIGFAILLFYIFFFRVGIFNEIREEEGLITSILSMRDELLLEEMLPFIKNEWNWINYLFGSYNDNLSRSQMGFIDIFYFWGLLGGLLYVYLYYKTFAIFKATPQNLYIVFALIIIIFLAGNFFENGSVAIYMLVFQKSLLLNQNSLQVKNT